jgi:hypothetical protein
MADVLLMFGKAGLSMRSLCSTSVCSYTLYQSGLWVRDGENTRDKVSFWGRAPENA